ncbi:16S rRNA (uracil1498-N3)-methyltransferase [Thermoflavifilum aggregans]|uniref:Ribosomal RNA small subunit methyltransferase E n=1 Tax=Thermoflavifilum aggregans TaxID=454188 RepID=A0A2M9CSY7_9BACT|nr:RsmE family RNA methyltransferase [Thermoflavifilum aggregans]PJJ75024.1 16S rRNA (uracil1498-N3)-methyltransferase [Thermoflavifilum aggregans]
MDQPYPVYQRTEGLPLFFVESLPDGGGEVRLDALSSRHCIQVLRMQLGDELQLTNGRGLKARAALTAVHTGGRKASAPVAIVRISTITQQPPPPDHFLAIALPHHAGRAEWLIEKATELGIRHIVPLLTARSPHGRWKPERYRQLMIAAMLQSSQYYVPELHAPTAFGEWVHTCHATCRAIAHCEPTARIPIWQLPCRPGSKCVLIGPEGDFTPEEIETARQAGWQEVSLGYTRLRTETAAIVACAWMQASAFSST